MKEIIEKIDELKKHYDYIAKHGTDLSEKTMIEAYAVNKYAKELKRYLKKEENKPFNPELLGFKEKGNSAYIKKLKDGFECDLVKVSESNKWTFSYYPENEPLNPLYLLIIELPNHRQGREFFKSLGVI